MALNRTLLQNGCVITVDKWKHYSLCAKEANYGSQSDSVTERLCHHS